MVSTFSRPDVNLGEICENSDSDESHSEVIPFAWPYFEAASAVGEVRCVFLMEGPSKSHTSCYDNVTTADLPPTHGVMTEQYIAQTVFFGKTGSISPWNWFHFHLSQRFPSVG